MSPRLTKFLTGALLLGTIHLIVYQRIKPLKKAIKGIATANATLANNVANKLIKRDPMDPIIDKIIDSIK